MPSLEQMMEMRGGNPVAYSFFLYHFAPAVGGMYRVTDMWRVNNEGTITTDNMLSRSSEAFALLALENSWEVWTTYHAEVVGRNKEDIATMVKPDGKYTRGKGRSAKKHKGWSNEGKLRYNELLQKVKLDRSKFGSKGGQYVDNEQRTFDRFFAEAVFCLSNGCFGINAQGNEGNRGSKKRQEAQQQPVVEAEDDW